MTRFSSVWIRLWAGTLAALLTATTAERPARGQDIAPSRYLTGLVLDRKLAEPIGVSWSGRRLRDVVESLARNVQVCVLLDRRIDPNTPVEWSADGVPLGEILSQLATKHGLAVARLGSVLVIGPGTTTPSLPAIAAERRAEADSLPTALRTLLAASRPLTWPDLAEPSTLLDRLAAEAGLTVVDGQAVPHDLLYHVTTPPLTLVERLTFVTFSLGLTYRIDGERKTLTVSALPSKPAGMSAASPAGQSSTKTTGKPAETAASKTAMPNDAGRPSVQVFTLRVQDVPLRKLIEVLRVKHGLKIRVDEAAVAKAGLTLDKNTAVSVEHASLETLLDQAAKPLGLKATARGDTVEIGPRQ